MLNFFPCHYFLYIEIINRKSLDCKNKIIDKNTKNNLYDTTLQ